MSKLTVDDQTVFELFSNKKSDFLIPDYQRPYAWGEPECQTIWDDLFSFAFPDEDSDSFNSDDDEYFLGPIVTFRNKNEKLEIIDGQQRLTTLLLLLRAFYSKFGNMKDINSKRTAESIAKCIWKTNEFGEPDTEKLKIDSEVFSDNVRFEFLDILKTGTVSKEQHSRYATNYSFFEKKINEFLDSYPSYFAYFPTRIMNNCILLPIEAESQDTALRIFSTLNDRGMPLTDTDIFKAQFYKYYSDENKKDEFISRWKKLEELTNEIFKNEFNSPMDELFTRYMYYERAKLGEKNTTTEALRKFFEKNNYDLLKNETALSNLERIAYFWEKVYHQDDSMFPERILKQLSILHRAPNGMWTYILTVYFMQNADSEGRLEESKLFEFLNRITALVWVYAVMRPGVNALRTPLYPEMVNIISGKEIEFNGCKFKKDELRSSLDLYDFSNFRDFTRSMLAWWMYQNPDQTLIPDDMILQVEHIYPSGRQEKEKGLTNPRNLESLGNKALLERNINIRASDYRFEDKKKYYQGFTTSSHKVKPATIDLELINMSKKFDDFTEKDIEDRKGKILDAFVRFAEDNNLLI